MTGRVETEAPDANVRIGLQRSPLTGTNSRTSIRPARPSVAPVSNVEEADEPRDSRTSPRRGRIGRTRPACAGGRGGAERAGPRLSANRESLTDRSRSGLDPGPSNGIGECRGEAAQGDRSSARRQSGAARPDRECKGEDDEENPLPPALEPGSRSGPSRIATSSARRRPVVSPGDRLSSARRAGILLSRATTPQPDDLPRELRPGRREASPDAYAPS